MPTTPTTAPLPPPATGQGGFVPIETFPNGTSQGFQIVNGLPVFGGTASPGAPFLPAGNALSPDMRAKIMSLAQQGMLFGLGGAGGGGGGGSGGGGGGGFNPQPNYAVIGQFLPGLNSLFSAIQGAKVPAEEQALRNTVLGSLTNYLTGRGGVPGQLFQLPGQYTAEINDFVGGQVSTQQAALAQQYKQAQQDILANAATQGFNPAGALGMLGQQFAQSQAALQTNASTLRFQSAEGARNRIAQSFLPQAVQTSQFGLDIPNRQITALGGTFGNIAGGASSLQNAAFTPAQIQAQVMAAQIAAATQKSIADMNAANQLQIALINAANGGGGGSGGGGVNPLSALLGFGTGQFGGAVGSGLGNNLLNAFGLGTANNTASAAGPSVLDQISKWFR